MADKVRCPACHRKVVLEEREGKLYYPSHNDQYKPLSGQQNVACVKSSQRVV